MICQLDLSLFYSLICLWLEVMADEWSKAVISREKSQGIKEELLCSCLLKAPGIMFLKKTHYAMCFENHFHFFWHFRTTALSKGLSSVLRYWDLASTFYLVQQQKTLSLPWLCCEWVDAVKLLMLQEIYWGIYSAFVALRLMLFFLFLSTPCCPLWGFCWIVYI